MIDLVVAAGTAAQFGAFPVTARVAGINKVAGCACRHIVRRIDFRAFARGRDAVSVTVRDFAGRATALGTFLARNAFTAILTAGFAVGAE